jgi:hypothetical protein
MGASVEPLAPVERSPGVLRTRRIAQMQGGDELAEGAEPAGLERAQAHAGVI